MLKTTFWGLFSIALTALLAVSATTAFGADEPCLDAKPECLEHIRKESNQGNTDAQLVLGLEYSIGKIVEENLRESYIWLLIAKASGSELAGLLLELAFMEDALTPEEINSIKSEAEQRFLEIKNRKNSVQTSESSLPKKSDKKNKDPCLTKDEVCVQQIRKAAKQGDAAAQLNLGLMYHKGKGVTKDIREAVRWYLMAANQGIIDAQYNIGKMYYEGEGIVENEEEAYIWFLIAKAGGNKKASQALRENTWKWSWHGGYEDLAAARAKTDAGRRMAEIEKRRQ